MYYNFEIHTYKKVASKTIAFCHSLLRISSQPDVSLPPVLQVVIFINKDVLLYNHSSTLKISKLASIHEYHLILRPHSSFTVVSIMPFISEGFTLISHVLFRYVFLVSFSLEPVLSFCWTFMTFFLLKKIPNYDEIILIMCFFSQLKCKLFESRGSCLN